MVRFLLLISSLCCFVAKAQNLNFTTTAPLYPDGATSHNYPNIGNPAVDVSIDISSSGAQSFGLGTPKRVSSGLQIVVDFASTSDSKTIVIRFSQGVSNLTFNILGIEKAANYHDRVDIHAERYNKPGFNPPSAPANAPTLSPSAYAGVSGSGFIGTSDDPGSAASTVSFSDFVQVIYITYSSGESAPANPTAQGITLGDLNWAAPLPVNLLYFRAQSQQNRVALSWATTSERNADRFVVERGRDLSKFVSIGEVGAKGTTDQRQQYGLVDERPLYGSNYYRLKQIDTDGSVQYSKIIAAVVDDGTPSFDVLGNPTEGNAIHVAGRNLSATGYQLMTLTGQELTVTALPQADESLLLVPKQLLSPGVYLLKTNDGVTRLVRKVIVR